MSLVLSLFQTISIFSSSIFHSHFVPSLDRNLHHKRSRNASVQHVVSLVILLLFFNNFISNTTNHWCHICISLSQTKSLDTHQFCTLWPPHFPNCVNTCFSKTSRVHWAGYEPRLLSTMASHHFLKHYERTSQSFGFTSASLIKEAGLRHKSAEQVMDLVISRFDQTCNISLQHRECTMHAIVRCHLCIVSEILTQTSSIDYEPRTHSIFQNTHLSNTTSVLHKQLLPPLHHFSQIKGFDTNQCNRIWAWSSFIVPKHIYL